MDNTLKNVNNRNIYLSHWHAQLQDFAVPPEHFLRSVNLKFRRENQKQNSISEAHFDKIQSVALLRYVLQLESLFRQISFENFPLLLSLWLDGIFSESVPHQNEVHGPHPVGEINRGYGTRQIVGFRTFTIILTRFVWQFLRFDRALRYHDSRIGSSQGGREISGNETKISLKRILIY